MTTITIEELASELGTLIGRERRLEKLLERASRHPVDPREVAHLWNLATECRDHARILSRHRRSLLRGVPEVPYPRWPRGKGPTPSEALEESGELAGELAGEYRSTQSLSEDPYLRKFMVILGEEHDRRAVELKCLSKGSGIFEDLEEPELE